MELTIDHVLKATASGIRLRVSVTTASCSRLMRMGPEHLRRG